MNPPLPRTARRWRRATRQNKLHFPRIDRRGARNWMLSWTGQYPRRAEGGLSRGGGWHLWPPSDGSWVFVGWVRRGTSRGVLDEEEGTRRKVTHRDGERVDRLRGCCFAETRLLRLELGRWRLRSLSHVSLAHFALFGTFFGQKKLALSQLAPLRCYTIQVALATF